MAPTISLPTGIAPKNAGLEVWMERVLERADLVRDHCDADAVHDLRVALRRCRSMADALREVNPGVGWRKIKKASRELFHTLGDLRDMQVEQSWVKKLGPSGDPVRKHMLRLLSQQEKPLRQSAEQALAKFDRKEWRKLSRKLASKAHFFPLGSVVFQRLALTKLNEAVELYQRARKRPSSIAWHRLRIGLKRFRYIVENFLPRRGEVWAKDLKWVQDLLGDVHDLDVLRRELRRLTIKLPPGIVAQWLGKIDAERKTRLDEFRAKAAGNDSPWLVWRAGFQWGHAPVAAPLPERQTA